MEVEEKEDTFNVMALSLVIVIVLMLVSLVVLLFTTHDAYLDAYFILDVFFDAQDTSASSELAPIAFSSGLGKFLPLFALVVVDNISRILIVSFILAAVIDFLSYANIEEFFNELRARFMNGHVIVCGYNELSAQLIERLYSVNKKCVVIEQDRKKVENVHSMRTPILNMDFTEEQAMKLANISKASAVVLASENDADNVLGALVARRLNSGIKIVSRLKDEHVRKKAYIVGADMSVIPEHLAGLEIGEFVRKGMVREW